MTIDHHPPRRFPHFERKLLLAQAGVGECVLQRLESVGFGSLAELRQAGPEQAVLRVCEAGGGSGWTNRRRALARALHAASQMETTCV